MRISPELAAEFIDFRGLLPKRYTVSGFKWDARQFCFVATVTGSDAAEIRGGSDLWFEDTPAGKLVFKGWR